VLVGAGDITRCAHLEGAEAVAKLLDNIPGTVFTAGDNSNDSGLASEYANCFGPTWGRHLGRIRPAVGNHDYTTPGAPYYYQYFGAAAGDPKKGYYSYNLGSWHILVLNSNCRQIGGCEAGSPEEQWIRADLAAHPTACTLAYWHHPRFSSGQHGDNALLQPFWQALYDHGVDVVVNGHDHDYERFAPQDPSGNLDPVRGIREFVSGTGGAGPHVAAATIDPNSEVLNDKTLGVLKLTLHPKSYDWEFVPVAGKTFTDSGSGSCHGVAAMPTPTATASSGSFQPQPPIQAAFFYPWFPKAWTQSGIYPYTNYTPSLGYYSSTDDATIDEQLRLAQGAHLDAFIASWWGQGTTTDTAFQYILNRSERSESPYPGLRWAVYYEPEGQGDPSVSQIVSDLQYLADKVFSHPGYLRVDGRPVVFVSANGADGSGMADRWAQAKAQLSGNVYVVLKVYSGYKSDPNQPDSWYQYSPAVAYDAQLPYSVTVSPGFWKVGEQPRLLRDPTTFETNVQRMATSGAFWQLITTWNEWGEGTSVEPAAESGNTYIDILCRSLPGSAACGAAGGNPTPTPPPVPTGTPTPTSIPGSTR
jgi:hypothetical protein